MLAFWLEHRFSKDQILTIYLNRVYLGAGTYGVDAAVCHYFGKPATRATLYQSALLAGLLKAPARLNPTRDPEGTDHRAALARETMVASGFIPESGRDTGRARVRQYGEHQVVGDDIKKQTTRT